MDDTTEQVEFLICHTITSNKTNNLLIVLINLILVVQAETSECQPDHDITDDMDDTNEQVDFLICYTIISNKTIY